ncbi:hypothetical protein BD310DRAFT_678838 [Dichomitus squalens]|uniref:Uncharacterized protein n=1 Tax=Dichomitus squalens TaxID=114155 RepID=A0A4Q9PN26_9APHY|nr:hypothetical protein BD310DRAFT_678838 [Dichomitus squalens]
MVAASSSYIPRNARLPGKAMASPLRWEGITVIPTVVDAPRFHPSRAEVYLSQSCGHYAKIPDRNSRQRKWGDTQNELSRNIGYVFAPLYSNIQMNTFLEWSGYE